MTLSCRWELRCWNSRVTLELPTALYVPMIALTAYSIMTRFVRQVTLRPVELTDRLVTNRLRLRTILTRAPTTLRVVATRRVLLCRKRGPVSARRSVVPSWNVVIWKSSLLSILSTCIRCPLITWLVGAQLSVNACRTREFRVFVMQFLSKLLDIVFGRRARNLS